MMLRKNAGLRLHARKALSGLCALCAVAVLFAPVLAHGRVLAVGDGLRESIPAFFGSAARWQPAMLLGFPIYADPNKMYWYPLRLFRYIPWGFNLYMIAAYALALWATYAYVRNVTGIAVAAIASAAAFTFGGFMIAHIGQPMVIHPAAWCCVTVWSLDAYLRTARGRYLAGVAVGEAVALTSGQPQITAFTFSLAVAYLIVIGFSKGNVRATVRSYVEGLSAIVLGITAGAAAWLPTIGLGTASVRSGVDFAAFVADSLPLGHVAWMLTYPFAGGGGAEGIYHGAVMPADVGGFTETSCYVGLGTIALACLAPFSAARRIAAFWILVAMVGFALALGDATPFASWAYGVPGFNLFRIPGRHAFELTFAVSTLAGLGIAALARKACGRTAIALSIAGGAVLLGVATVEVRTQNPRALYSPAVAVFAFLCLLEVALLAVAGLTRSTRLAAVLGCLVVVVAVWPFAQTAYWRDAPNNQVTDEPPYAKLLKQLPIKTGQRIYSVTDDGTSALQPNLPTLWGLPELGGYTPLQLATVSVLLQTGAEGRLLDPTSPLVDLAGVRYAAVNTHPETVVSAAVPFGPEDLGVFLSRGRPEAPRQLAFGLSIPRSAQRLALVTALGASVDVAQDKVVAIVSVRNTAGQVQRFPLRAGRETAEFAYDRPDIRGIIRHRAAALFAQYGPNRWYQYVKKLYLRGRIKSVSIRVVDQHAALNVRKISLIDDGAALAYPISLQAPYYADESHFAHVRDVGGVSIFEDMRAYPPVWIPRFIRTENMRGFDNDRLAALRERLRTLDLQRTALIKGPTVTYAIIGQAHITHDEPERRDVIATCLGRCLLISNETYVEGWNVDVDGFAAPLVRVDGLLQGTFIPGGHHHVIFRYRPTAYRNGVALSLASFALIFVWLGTRRWLGTVAWPD